MNRENLGEIGYIVPIQSVSSILKHGLLSLNERRARGIVAPSVADAAVQSRRDKKTVPNGLALHDYVNIYICPRNPMLYRVKNGSIPVCVIRVSAEVLEIPNTVIADKNASSDYVRFHPSPEGLAYINEEITFAKYWNHDDPIEKMRHVSAMCAEVLVPKRVDPKHILGISVRNGGDKDAVAESIRNVEVDVDRHLFFME